jgi:RNA:NAD 2'-phosphotransferase (TPT1/KptA family)
MNPKLKDMVPKYVYHITPKKNLASIRSQGIVPTPECPAPFCQKAVYLFDDRTKMEDAMMNWLSDKFPEDEPLVCLTIDARGLELHESSVGYEIVSYNAVPWKSIRKVEDV